MVSTPTHTRIRPFDTKDTCPEQNLRARGLCSCGGAGQRIMRSAVAWPERTAEYDLSPGEALYLHRRYVTG